MAAGLAFTSVNAADVESSQAASAAGSSLLATNCAAVETNAAPLPPRPILARATFAAPLPHRIARHRPIRHKKTLAKKAARPVKAVKAKTVSHKRVRPRARALVHARPHPTPVAAASGRPTLHKLTFASPICDDLAPAMSAFGLDTVPVAPIGDELADAITKSLVPQNVDFPGALPQNGGGSNGPLQSASSGFPGFGTLPPLLGGGGGSTGTGSNGGGGNTGTGGNGGNNGGGGSTGTPPGGTGPGGPGITPPGGTPPGSVPEPASWMTMILGFGLAGATLRRRRRQPDRRVAKAFGGR